MSPSIEKLGRLLIREGLISPAQLSECLKEHEARGPAADTGTLSEIIVSRGFVDRETMTRSLEAAVPGWSSMAESPAQGPPPEVVEARRDPKRVLRKYTLVGELGRGGMAVVYKAWDDSLQKYVALKLIRTQDIGLADAAREEEVQEFLREARTAVKLSHPNIVRVYELGCHEDRYYLSMEYIEGRNLELLLRPDRKHPLCREFYAAPKRFLVILRDIALALDYAHRQDPPIVHRDIKPQNILVDGSGRACVVDFGLAKEMKQGTTLTVSGIVKGTPCYMAPEQALGRGGAGVDARTDVWALGAVLYECLAGVPPFTGPTQRDILNKVVNEEPLRPSEVHRRRGSAQVVVPDLEKICLKALEKDKAKRYRSAREFAGEIDRFFSGKSVRARGVRGYERAWRGVARNKGVAAAAAVAVLMGFVALAALFRNREPERIVEKVVVESESEARIREASEKVRSMASEMQFDRAARGYQELLSTVEAGKDREALKGQLEEVRLQEVLLAELVARIQEKPRDFARFALKDTMLEDARLLDATSQGLIMRYEGKAVQAPWGKVAPIQFALLVRELCPRLGGDAALGYVSWSARHSLREQALGAAEPLRGTTRETRAREFLARAGIAWPAEAKGPAPVVKLPEPPPPAPVRAVAAPAEPPPAVRRAYAESPLPPTTAWTYQAAWRHHGYPLADALVRRGWEDLAEEVALNTMNDPAGTADARARGALMLARIHGARAGREASLPERIKLLDWGVQGVRQFLLGNPAHALQGEAQAELSRLEGLRGRALIGAGHAEAAFKAFEACEASLNATIKKLEADRRNPADAGYLEWNHESLSTRYRAALMLLSRAEALGALPNRTETRTRTLQDLRRQLRDDFLWRAEGTLLGTQGYALLGAVSMRLALSADREEAEAYWTDAFAALREAKGLQSVPNALRHPEIRSAIGRAMLGELQVRNAYAEVKQGMTGVRVASEGLKALEDLGRAIPELRTGDLSLPLILEEARALGLSGQSELAMKKLQGLPADADASIALAGLGRSGRQLEALLAADPRDAEVVAAGAALAALRGQGDARARAQAWYRLGLAYYEIGRDFEAAAAFAVLEDPAYLFGDRQPATDAAVRRLVCLRRIHESTREESDRKAFDEFSVRAQGMYGAAADPAGAEILGHLEAHRRIAPPRPRSVVPRDPLAHLHSVPPGGATPLGLTQASRAFSQRIAPLRGPAATRGGLDPVGEEAILSSLRWLARHQSADGSWKTQAYISECKKVPKFSSGGNCTPNPGGYSGPTQALTPSPLPFKCGGGVEVEAVAQAVGDDYDAGVTGLAVLAFLGAGYSHQSREAYDGIVFGDVVRKGLQWMMVHQDPEGCVGSRNAVKYLTSHLVCALALTEAYGLTGSMLLKDRAQKALDFTVAAQNPGKGWRYSYKCGDSDTSSTGWAVLGLKAAELAGLSFPKAGYDGARAWFDEVTEESYARAGYTHKGTGKVLVPGANEQFDHHEALTAMAVTSRLLMDRQKGDPRVTSGVDLLLRDLPKWDGNAIDYFYWHWGSLAVFQLDGPSGAKWKKWNEAAKVALLGNQNTGASGCKHGSWETIDRWSGDGGRVYTTAINALTLQTCVRYPSMLESPRK